MKIPNKITTSQWLELLGEPYKAEIPKDGKTMYQLCEENNLGRAAMFNKLKKLIEAGKVRTERHIIQANERRIWATIYIPVVRPNSDVTMAK